MKNLSKFSLIFLVLIFALAQSASVSASVLSDRLKGRILLQVEARGEAWYVNPVNFERYYLGRPADAFRIMRELGLGISNHDFDNLKGVVPAQLAGRILIKVEDKGRAYYADPVGRKLHYLGRPADAFVLMRSLGLGINNNDLKMIAIAKNYDIPVASMTPENQEKPIVPDDKNYVKESSNENEPKEATEGRIDQDNGQTSAEPEIVGTKAPAEIAAAITWTKAQSPYIVESDVLVKKNAVLTVQPGVKIIFKPAASGAGHSLVINGELSAVGTDNEPIYFQGLDEMSKGQSWNAIELVNGGRATLRFVSVSQARYGVNAPNAANLLVSDSVFAYCGTGLRFSGPATIQNNRVLYNNTGLIFTADTASSRDDGSFRLFDRLSTVERNTIKNNGNSDSEDEGGLIVRGVKAAGANLTFRFNRVEANTTGISLLDSDFFNSLRLEKNDIINSAYYNARVGKTGTTVNMENNWWGATDPDQIAAKIYDYFDVNESWAQIDYRPYLNASAL